MTQYRPDKSDAHQRYKIQVEKKAHTDNDCLDHGQTIVHSKADLDNLVKLFRELGFAIHVSRITETTMIDEEFPSDKEDQGGQAHEDA